MRYDEKHKQQTRRRVLDAAGEVFRRDGFGGAGIDALTKAAGVTNGAFYGHFKSKGDAFREAVIEGLQDLRLGIGATREALGRDWFGAFVSQYLGAKRTCDLGQSCGLASLTPEVMRAEPETKAAYETELIALIEETAAGLEGETDLTRQDKAVALLALLSGGVTMSRAVADPALASRLAATIERQALALR